MKSRGESGDNDNLFSCGHPSLPGHVRFLKTSKLDFSLLKLQICSSNFCCVSLSFTKSFMLNRPLPLQRPPSLKLKSVLSD